MSLVLEVDVKKIRISPGEKLTLDASDHEGTALFEGDKRDALKKIEKLKGRLDDLQGKQPKN